LIYFSDSMVALLLLPLLLPFAVATAAPCRDRFLEPFSSTSIWNTAIGSNASFDACKLFRPGRLPSQFHNDQDFFLKVTSADPLTPWVDQGDWGSDNHCAIQGSGRVVAHLNFPENFTTASDCDPNGANCRSAPNQANNNAMGVLLPDDETIVQMQPAYRCIPGAGSPLLAKFGNRTDGCPEQFPNVTVTSHCGCT
jgi:hypothetical protein